MGSIVTPGNCASKAKWSVSIKAQIVIKIAPTTNVIIANIKRIFFDRYDHKF